MLQEVEEKAPPIKHPETFIEARAKLMALREKAWRMAVRRHTHRQEEREVKLEQDRAEHESDIKKITHPVTEIPNRRGGTVSAASHTSMNTAPVVVVGGLAKQSRRNDPGSTTEAVKDAPENAVFPCAKNRREAFRAYVAKRLLRLKASLFFHHRLDHANKDPLLDQWGRVVKTDVPLFDPRNPYLVKVIKNLMRTKAGFRFKYETRAEELLTNFPFVEFQTYRKFPVTRMTKHDRIKHHIRIKKLYRGQKLFKLMTP